MPDFPFTPRADIDELTDDVRELFDELAASLTSDQRTRSGECRPSIDVFETDEAIEVVVDVCAVPAEALRVFFRSGILIIAGEKAPTRATAEHTFHLVEREFGRFARAVQLTGAIDIPNARASVSNGELSVVLPKLLERRGQGHRIPVAPPTRGSA